MDRVDEMTSPPIVGRYYLVPCAWGRLCPADPLSWIPVTGPHHEDAKHLNFPWHHWHLDGRFLTPKMWADIGREPEPPLFTVLVDGKGPVEYARRRCWREQPAYLGSPPRHPFPPSFLVSKSGLRAAYARARLRGPCKVCPHRGVPLASLPASADGTVTCPGHGLKWDVSTGRLVRRSPPP